MPFEKILNDLKTVLEKINKREIDVFVRQVKKARRIYVVGAGRSGLIAKYLAMRLVRLKKETFVIGETITPKIKTGDLLIAVSGSGETGDILSAVKISRVLGAKILAVCGVANSALAKVSHFLVIVPAKIPQRLGDQYQLRELVGVPERSPTGSLFEVCSLIFLEIAVSKLMEVK